MATVRVGAVAVAAGAAANATARVRVGAVAVAAGPGVAAALPVVRVARLAITTGDAVKPNYVPTYRTAGTTRNVQIFLMTGGVLVPLTAPVVSS
jgi:hypothetical protein